MNSTIRIRKNSTAITAMKGTITDMGSTGSINMGTIPADTNIIMTV